MSEWWKSPFVVTLGALVAIVGVIWVTIRLVIPACGVALGIAGYIIKNGVASAVSAGFVVSWVAPAATISVAVVGVTSSVFLIVNVAERAKEDPYEWLMPVLAILAGFTIDVCKEFSPWGKLNLEIGKAVFGALTTVLFFMGGVFWQRPGWLKKVLGSILFLLPPAWILLISYTRLPHENIYEFLQKLDRATRMAIGGLFFLLLLAALLAYSERDKSNWSRRRV